MKTKYLILVFFLLNSMFNFLPSNGKLMAQSNSENWSKKMIEMDSFVIFAGNPEISKNFYKNIFDLKVKLDLPGYIQFEGGITLWDKKNALDVIFKDVKTKKDSPAIKTFELYFVTEDIEAVLQKLVTAGVTFIHKLETQPWSQRVVRFYDPDNNIIEIGEKMESVVKRLNKQNLSDEEIAKKTFLPVEAVREILKQ